MKKLIPTITMALLSAAMLGTSTYAWFSANKTVTADGISLNAKADGSLLISTSQSSGYASSCTLKNDHTPGDHYAPVTPVLTSSKITMDSATGAIKFEELTQKGMEQVGEDGKFNKPSDFSTNRSDYYTAASDANIYLDTVYVKYSGSDTKDLDVSAQITTTTTDGADEIWQAMKVLCVVKSKTTGTTPTYSVKSSNDIAFTKKATDTSGGTIQAITNGDVVEIDVYAYVDGEDTNCKNANALNGTVYNIGLTFTASAQS